ncbi:MAG: AraC family transcriptional regulator [Chryseobacterium sp.]|nr:MAG: AraC family transcriptional regulator [Chryseobacterium sp.]
MDFHYDFVSYTIAEREMFFVFPGALCEIRSFSSDISFAGIVFTNNYLKKQGVVLSSANFMHLFSSSTVRKQRLSKEDHESIRFHILSLKRKMEMPAELAHVKEIQRHSFISVLYEVFLVQDKQRVFLPVKLDRKEELTGDFLNLVSRYFLQERKVQFYAKTLFVTPRHLSQVVKQVTGKTAGELIDEIVIKEAKALLSAHTFNVSQVTDVLNFSDQSFFGKFFKKHTGISPSDYRLNSSVA